MPSATDDSRLPNNKSLLSRTIRTLIKHPTYGALRFDTFRQAIITPDSNPFPEHEILNATVWAQSGVAPTNPKIVEYAILWIAHQHRYDSLIEHVEGLPAWDGVPRLDTWLVDWFAAEDTPFVRLVGRKWLVSAMARALQPGCKVDHTLVLHGPRQGEGKSEAIKILGLGDRFTREMNRDINDKDTLIAMQGTWFGEFPDLGSLPRSSMNAIKGFLTQTSDAFRPPYGRVTVAHPRRCVFVVTTNDLDFVSDPSGARRFWPVTVGKRSLDFEKMGMARNQLLAEAYGAHQALEKWWFSEEVSFGVEGACEMGMSSLTESVKTAQDELQQGDTWEDRIAGWVQGRNDVTIPKLLVECLGMALADTGKGHQMRAAACLKRLGFNRLLVRVDGPPQRVWRRE